MNKAKLQKLIESTQKRMAEKKKPVNEALSQSGLSEFVKRYKEVEGQSLADRKAAAKEYFEAIKNPEHFAKEVELALNGDFGEGAYTKIQQILGMSKRANKVAGVAQILAIYSFGCPDRLARDMFNKLSPEEQKAVNDAIAKVLTEAEKELTEGKHGDDEANPEYDEYDGEENIDLSDYEEDEGDDEELDELGDELGLDADAEFDDDPVEDADEGLLNKDEEPVEEPVKPKKKSKLLEKLKPFKLPANEQKYKKKKDSVPMNESTVKLFGPCITQIESLVQSLEE